MAKNSPEPYTRTRSLHQNKARCCSPQQAEPPQRPRLELLARAVASPALAPDAACAAVPLRVSGSLSPRTFLGCSVTCLVSSCCFVVVVTGFF